ncbi:MAG: zf-TFIIB domain-containing protein, partial [Deltaproteobacteria bacterium]|nr:zf-TFIIB domain-containing protein [Deltaproteobacteria bacterium]
DVTHIIVEEFPCRCGETLRNTLLKGVEVAVHRCTSCGAIITNPSDETCDYCSAVIERDFDKMSLICPECYARNAEESRFCTGCGVGFHPEALQVDGEELPCPQCEILMPATGIAGVSVNECGKCHGLWVNGSAFDLLVNRAIEARKNNHGLQLGEAKPRVTGANPAEQQVMYRRCPNCNGMMNRQNYRKNSGIIIDACSDHGTWLDADELEQIAGFVLNGGLAGQASKSQEEKRAADERAAMAFERYKSGDSVWVGEKRSHRSQGGIFGFLTDTLEDILLD